MPENENLENMVQELRRGLLVLAVLSQLGKPQYGYALLKRLAERGMEIDQGTLYPLLRRLEAQGLLQSSWDVEAGRPRRYYTLNPAGRRLFARLRTEYDGMVAAMGGMLK